jgi:hypothetical protein
MKKTTILKKVIKHILVEDAYGCTTCFHARYEKRNVEHSAECIQQNQDSIKKVKTQAVFQSNLRGLWIIDQVNLPDNIDVPIEQVLLAFRKEVEGFTTYSASETGNSNNKSCLIFSDC